MATDKLRRIVNIFAAAVGAGATAGLTTATLVTAFEYVTGQQIHADFSDLMLLGTLAGGIGSAITSVKASKIAKPIP